MITIEVLKEFGANTDEGLERCLNDEGFYLKLVPDSLKEEQYKKIEDSINAGDLDEAFEACHALKGVLANLALTPIFEPVDEMTELLRSRTQTDYSPMLKKMWEQRNKLVEFL